ACGPCTSTPFGSAIPPSRIFSSAIAPSVVASAENGLRGVPQPPDAELEILYRNPFVGRVDERVSHVHGQRPRREEPVANGPERLAQPVAVSEADAGERSRTRPRVLLGDELLHGPPQRSVERGAGAALRLLRPHQVVPHVAAENCPDERLDVLRALTGEESTVDLDVAKRGDDVP